MVVRPLEASFPNPTSMRPEKERTVCTLRKQMAENQTGVKRLSGVGANQRRQVAVRATA